MSSSVDLPTQHPISDLPSSTVATGRKVGKVDPEWVTGSKPVGTGYTQVARVATR
jgi:hypothetical protein